MNDIKQQLSSLPGKPGVYLMFNSGNKVIYVGKAMSLKNRVRQYFHASSNRTAKVNAMISNIFRFEYIVTDTEIEALILECNLIKRHNPKYNILLRDDKTYPYIKVTVNEEYPRVMKTRQVLKDKAKYFGPYTVLDKINEVLGIIKEAYPIRDCSKNIARMLARRERPCLNYYIGKCIGPCKSYKAKKEYLEMIDEIIMLLSGKSEELIDQIQTKMKESAAKLNYELAAKCRDQLIALDRLKEKQKINSDKLVNQDYIAIASSGGLACVQIFFVRDGKLVHREHFTLTDEYVNERKNTISAFIKQYYNAKFDIPKEIFIEEAIEEQEVIDSWLSDKRGNKVKVNIPIKGDKKKVLDLVRKNADIILNNLLLEKEKEAKESKTFSEELGELLGIKEHVYRVEGFDISNISGVESVGSMVVFENGEAIRKDYRRFKIKTIEGANDYGSIEEIICRRFKRGLEETKGIIDKEISFDKGKFSVFPDIIMIDGGKGQVSSVEKSLLKLGLNIPVCGMVKDNKHTLRGLYFDKTEYKLSSQTSIYRLLAYIQDEAHRFALNYHKSLRNKSMLASILRKIPYIGEKKSKILMKFFLDIKRIKGASVEDLYKVEGISSTDAQRIYSFFQHRRL